MNITTDILRKRISLYTMLLACILFVGLGCYAISPLVRPPELFYRLFPVWIWGKIAITDGDTYLVISSICLLMICTIPLFIWGYAYPGRKHFTLRLEIWIILFYNLLLYSLIVAAVTHISAISSVQRRPSLPDGMYPMPFTAIDEMLSRTANTPPVYSWEFVVYMLTMGFYAAISVKIHLLLSKVRTLDNSEKISG